MKRILEPEVMDTREEAEAYDAMDHSAVNAAFVERVVELGASEGQFSRSRHRSRPNSHLFGPTLP